MTEHLDKVLDTVGADGRFQKLLILLVLQPVSFFSGFMNHQLLFEVVVPEHWCHVPIPTNTSLTVAQWRNITIPRTDDGQYSRCLMYDVIETQDGNTFTITNTTSPCRFGWDYDSTQFQATVATSFGWFCERAAYSQHIMAVTMAGNAAGSLLLPLLSDKYLGRRVMLVVTSGVYVVFLVPTLFLSHPAAHLVFRFLAAIFYPTYAAIPFILVMETVKCEWRSIVNGGFCVAFALGICAASLVAYVIPHWQALALISCLPHSLGPLYWWFVPESPRWLLSKGRLPECCRVLQRISVINGRGEVTRQELEEKLLLSTRQDKASQLHQVFHYPVLRHRILRLFLVGVGVHLSYGVVTMGINIMPSNYFLSLAILALVQLPGDTFSWVLAEFLGRRFTLITAILLAAVFCFVATFYLHHELLLVVVTGVVKLALVMSLQILYLVVSELLPTPIRSSGFGIICTIGFTSMIISPFLINPDLGVGFRYWAMLGCLLVSLVAVLAIPETVALPLPQDFLEAEQLGCGRPLTAWIHHWNHHKYSINTQPTVTPSSWPHDPEKQAAQSLNPSSTVAVA